MFSTDPEAFDVGGIVAREDNDCEVSYSALWPVSLIPQTPMCQLVSRQFLIGIAYTGIPWRSMQFVHIGSVDAARRFGDKRGNGANAMSPEIAAHETTTTSGYRSAWRWVWKAVLVVLLLPVVAYGSFVLYMTYGVDMPEDVSPPIVAKSRAEMPGVGKTNSAKTTVAKAVVAKTPAEVADDEFRQDIVGTWERMESGRRRFTINADGTAQLVYEPTGLKKFFLDTSKLTIQITWTIDGGYVEFRSVSGDPMYGFKVAIKSEGASKRRRIVDITSTTFTLANDEKKYVKVWKRVESR